ncbi:peptidoglycan-binding domain-containing protein [Fictibacillus gelatini]|uniref:peptidoglycan-binding domain-containing protein n=1 Tax=Fictibacillus gelatini TaxID=225985 RepID=UPI00042379D6|nr:peptidoglycan-binding domain-containing protein [Fictibacillus gelatini]
MKANKKWVTSLLVLFLSFFIATPSMASAAGFHHPEYWNKNSILKQGKSGTEVRNLQYILNVMSFYTETGIVDVDGIFGPKTAKAVKTYQKGNGLAPDGIVGPKTWKSFSKFIKKKSTSTYGAGSYMGLRLEWKYDNTSDSSPSTAKIYGNGDTMSDTYRLFAR